MFVSCRQTFSFFFFPFACARNGRTLRNDPARCVCCQDVCVCATPPSHHRRPRCQRLSGGDGGKHTSPRFKSLVSVGENERGDTGVGERERERKAGKTRRNYNKVATRRRRRRHLEMMKGKPTLEHRAPAKLTTSPAYQSPSSSQSFPCPRDRSPSHLWRWR